MHKMHDTSYDTTTVTSLSTKSAGSLARSSVGRRSVSKKERKENFGSRVFRRGRQGCEEKPRNSYGLSKLPSLQKGLSHSEIAL
jgi:hypothetical protein